MAEHATNDGIFITPETVNPSLVLVGEDTPPNANQWDNYPLMFSEPLVFGGGVSTTNPVTRGRNVYNTLLEVVPESLPESGEHNYADDLRDMHRHLDRKVTFDGQSVPTRELVDIQAVINGILADLGKVNHPVVQALRIVERENDQRIEHNAAQSVRQRPTLHASELAQLKEDLVFVSFPMTSKEKIRAAVNTAREQLRAQKQGKVVVELVEAAPNA